MIRVENKTPYPKGIKDNTEGDNTFDYFNSDVNLLSLRILLEGFRRKQNVFTLNQFLKGEYWKIEEINDEIRDTNDYGSVEDLVIHQIILMIDELKLGSIKRISIGNLRGLTERVIEKAVKLKDSSDDDVGYYSFLIDEIYKLKQIKDTQIEKDLADGKPYDFTTSDRLDFSVNEVERYLNFISSILTEQGFEVVKILSYLEKQQKITECRLRFKD